MSLAIGSRLGPYEITGALGAGGMGEVYRAHDPRIGRDVAVKVLPVAVSANRDHLQRFEQEARATGALNHPNLLVIFDFGTHGGAPFIVSELLEGTSLRDRMAEGRLPLRKSIEYAVQIAADAAPPALLRLLEHSLEKKRERRFESMKDVAFALEALTGSGASPAPKKSRAAKGSEKPTQPRYRRITFRRGSIMTARFAPDGSIIYGAAWEDGQLEILSAHPPDPEARPLGLAGADVLSVSPKGELAVALGRRYVGGWVTTGTLARRPIGGGAPRIVCEDVQEAEWTPDGKNLLIIRRVGGLFRIESPIGNVLYESQLWISHARQS